jgi:hypothetical protein
MKLRWRRPEPPPLVSGSIDPDDDFGSFRYKVNAHGIVRFTNSYRRWRRHYLMCKRLNIPGTWYKWDGRVKYGTPQYWPKAKVVVTNAVPRLKAALRDKDRRDGMTKGWRLKRVPHPSGTV